MRAITATFVLLLASTATAGAPDHSAPLPVADAGQTPVGNPYGRDIGLTKGKMEDFEKVFVDPAAFPGTLTPVAPPPVPQPTAISPLADGETGAGKTIKLTVASSVPKGQLTGEALAKTLTDKGVGTVTVNEDGSLDIVVGDKGLAHTFSFALGPVKGTWYRVQDLGTLQIMADEPEAPPAVEGDKPTEKPAEKPADKPAPVVAPEGEATVATPIEWVPLTVEAAPMPSAKGGQMLRVDNDRSAWADVKINGELAARIPPYGHGKVYGVAPGTYEIGFSVSNGYSWTRKVATATP